MLSVRLCNKKYAEEKNVKRTTLKIGGIYYAGCVNSIQNYVLELKGVKKCEVNL